MTDKQLNPSISEDADTDDSLPKIGNPYNAIVLKVFVYDIEGKPVTVWFILEFKNTIYIRNCKDVINMWPTHVLFHYNESNKVKIFGYLIDMLNYNHVTALRDAIKGELYYRIKLIKML